ncbi:hypothetical protein VTO42DRAFT_4194 [Malbranchea cinnamomea]
MSYSPRLSQVNPDAPPPPPPKPSSHEASRHGTPFTMQQPFAAPLSTPPKEALDSRSQLGTASVETPEAVPDEAFSTAHQPQPPGPEDNWIPDILKNKSTTDLHPLLSSPSLLSALTSTHPSLPASQAHLQSLLSSNIALASHVKSLELHLLSLRAATESLLLHHSSLELSWRKKQSEMDAALAPWSPKALYQRLSAAIAEQEAICEAVEESFLEEGGQDGNGGRSGQASDREVAEWVRQVRSEGAKLAARREARARWDEGRVGGWR